MQNFNAILLIVVAAVLGVIGWNTLHSPHAHLKGKSQKVSCQETPENISIAMPENLIIRTGIVSECNWHPDDVVIKI